jgi:hypothetical protein
LSGVHGSVVEREILMSVELWSITSAEVSFASTPRPQVLG